MKIWKLAPLLTLFYSLSCSGQSQLKTSDLDELYQRMTGSFSSELQSKSDSDYYDIRLHMVPVWPERTDGKWLYVEQAMATASDKPYRQRFYQLELRSDGKIESHVYTMNEPLRLAGAWKHPEILQQFKSDSLESKDGCSILLTKNKDGNFVGSTVEKQCPSNLRGATYATSEVVISTNQMISWDRGFDAGDKQVWGALKGGYVFVKQKE